MLVERIRRKRVQIEKIGGADWYNFVFSMYSGLHAVAASGASGGRDRSRSHGLIS